MENAKCVFGTVNISYSKDATTGGVLGQSLRHYTVPVVSVCSVPLGWGWQTLVLGVIFGRGEKCAGALDAQVGGVTLSHDVQGQPGPWISIKPSHRWVMEHRQSQPENFAIADGRAVSRRVGSLHPLLFVARLPRQTFVIIIKLSINYSATSIIKLFCPRIFYMQTHANEEQQQQPITSTDWRRFRTLTS